MGPKEDPLVPETRLPAVKVGGFWQDVRQRLGGLGHRRDVVLAEETGERGGDLALRHIGYLAAFAQGRRVWAEGGDPDELGGGDLLAVVSPIGRADATAVV